MKESTLLVRTGEGRSLLLFIWGMALLSVILPSYVFSHAQPDSYVHPVTLGITVVSGVWWAAVLAAKEVRVVEMVVGLFVYVFLGLAPMAQQALTVLPPTVPFVDLGRVGHAGGVIAGGLAALFLGVLLRSRQEKPRTQIPGQLSERRVAVLAALSFVCAAYVMLEPGLHHLFASRRDLDHARQITWTDSSFRGALIGGTNSLLLVSVISLILMRRRSAHKPLRWGLMLAAGIGLLFVLINPISSPRYVVGSMLFAIIAALGGYGTLRRYRAVSAIAMAGMVLVFPLGNAFRYADDGPAQVADPMLTLTTGDFDAFYQVVNGVEYVDINGTEQGRQILGAVLFWVPRSVWPNKPIDTGALVAKAKGYDYTNLSSPLWAEFYVDGGIPLVLAGMFGFGYWIRGSDITIRRLGSTDALTPVLCILPFYLIIVLRGSLLNAMSYLAVIVLASRFVIVRREDSRRRPSVAGRK